ncbi:MAG: hypothetical protein H0X38_15255 [Planctomycetes bacterium]|nr:hypothetical protein [Planctomycetota bacterium]
MSEADDGVLLIVVEDSFHVAERGVIPVPPIPLAMCEKYAIAQGREVRLILPDGTEQRTFIAGVEFFSRGVGRTILLPLPFGQVPKGTRILLIT